MDLWTPMRPWVFHPRVAEGEGPGATSVWLERVIGAVVNARSSR